VDAKFINDRASTASRKLTCVGSGCVDHEGGIIAASSTGLVGGLTAVQSLVSGHGSFDLQHAQGRQLHVPAPSHRPHRPHMQKYNENNNIMIIIIIIITK